MPPLSDTAAIAHVLRAGLDRIDRGLTEPPSAIPGDSAAERLESLRGTLAVLDAFMADPAVAAVGGALGGSDRWIWDAVARQLGETGRRLRGMQVSNPAWFDALMSRDTPETPRWFSEQGGSIRAGLAALTEADGSLAALASLGQRTHRQGAAIALRAVTAMANVATLTPETTPAAAFGALETAQRVLSDRAIADAIDASSGSAAMRSRLSGALGTAAVALLQAARIGAGATEVAAHRNSLSALAGLAAAQTRAGHEGVGA